MEGALLWGVCSDYCRLCLSVSELFEVIQVVVLVLSSVALRRSASRCFGGQLGTVGVSLMF